MWYRVSQVFDSIIFDLILEYFNSRDCAFGESDDRRIKNHCSICPYSYCYNFVTGDLNRLLQ